MGRILLAKFFEVGKLNFGSIFVTKAHHIFCPFFVERQRKGIKTAQRDALCRAHKEKAI